MVYNHIHYILPRTNTMFIIVFVFLLFVVVVAASASPKRTIYDILYENYPVPLPLEDIILYYKVVNTAADAAADAPIPTLVPVPPVPVRKMNFAGIWKLLRRSTV
jgi:hypothetical protein